MAFGHGLQDAAKTAGVVVLALNVGGYHTGDTVPLWVLLLTRRRDLAWARMPVAGGSCARWAAASSTSTRRRASPPRRRRRRSSTSRASVFGAPISTTHTITSAIMGVGATKRLSAVRWGVAGNIVGAWVLTFPGAGLAAAVCFWLIHLFI